MNDAYLNKLRNGETLEFGRTTLSKDTLELGNQSIKINTLKSASTDPNGDLILVHYGHNQKTYRLAQHDLADAPLLASLLNMLIDDTPQLKRRSIDTGFPQGSIGDTSIRIGTDVRELYIDGYTQADIHKVLKGELSLPELMKRGPSKE